MDGRATQTANPSGSATAPPTNINSMDTAGSSMPRGSSPGPATDSPPRCGEPSRGSPTASRGTGANPTPAFGKSETTRNTTCTPSSWRGSPSTGPCGSPPPTDSATRRRRTGGRPTRRDRSRGSEPRIRRSARSYMRSYGSDELDASLLVLPLLGIELPRRAARSGHDRCDPVRPRRRRALALPVPARAGRPAGHGRRVHAVRVLARTGTRQNRTIRDAAARFAALIDLATSTRPVRRRDGTRQRRPPRQLSPGAHPRRARPSGSCAPRC